jgi:hypothetical protein
LAAAALTVATPQRRVIEERAGPRIILFYGESLSERIYLVDKYENMRFVSSFGDYLRHVPEGALDDGPVVRVSMYWHNPTWEETATDTALLHRLRPERGTRAVIFAGSGGQFYYQLRNSRGHKVVGAEGVKILQRHGVVVAPLQSAQ